MFLQQQISALRCALLDASVGEFRIASLSLAPEQFSRYIRSLIHAMYRAQVHSKLEFVHVLKNFLEPY